MAPEVDPVDRIRVLEEQICASSSYCIASVDRQIPTSATKEPA